LKQQPNKLIALKLSVCLKIKVCYVFVSIFFQICQNSELLTFARYCGNILKVWWEVLHGFVGNLHGFPAMKFENPLRIDKVIEFGVGLLLFGTQYSVVVCNRMATFEALAVLFQ